ncbi:hypothetical protein, partial [Mycobacterium kansasii]|uniref:hypothetical protein n=2 Tax=Mycobacterium kansasii TaxID=1768 RepID=UPI001CA5E816
MTGHFAAVDVDVALKVALKYEAAQGQHHVSDHVDHGCAPKQGPRQPVTMARRISAAAAWHAAHGDAADVPSARTGPVGQPSTGPDLGADVQGADADEV